MTIGDSVAGATRCECARYPDLYAEVAGEAFGRPVRVLNLAEPGTTSGDLVAALNRSTDVQAAIRDADIIFVTTGINDVAACVDASDGPCYEAAIQSLAINLESLYGEIETLQGDHPYLLRQTAYYNFVIGAPGEHGSDPAFLAAYAEHLAALNQVICAAVEDHGGGCVELLPAFNGPDGDQDAAPFLVFDHVHPSREGHRLIADALAASGYEPLAP